MAIRRGRGWTAVGAVMVMAVVLSACGMFGKHAAKGSEDDQDEFAEEPYDQPRQSVLDLLDPEEREAVERSGMSGPLMDRDGAAAETDGPFTPERRAFEREPESKSDKAGKIGLSVLSVALSAAAVAAPFLLF